MNSNSTPANVGSNDGLGLSPERAAFEAWCVQRWRGDRNALGRNGDDHAKNPGEYTIGNVEFAWQAWQAARVDIVAALQWYADGLHFDKASPDAWDTVSGEPQNWWCDEARAVERAHGIKTSPTLCLSCGHSIDAHDRQYGCAEDGCDCETPNVGIEPPRSGRLE